MSERRVPVHPAAVLMPPVPPAALATTYKIGSAVSVTLLSRTSAATVSPPDNTPDFSPSCRPVLTREQASGVTSTAPFSLLLSQIDRRLPTALGNAHGEVTRHQSNLVNRRDASPAKPVFWKRRCSNQCSLCRWQTPALFCSSLARTWLRPLTKGHPYTLPGVRSGLRLVHAVCEPNQASHRAQSATRAAMDRPYTFPGSRAGLRSFPCCLRPQSSPPHTLDAESANLLRPLPPRLLPPQVAQVALLLTSRAPLLTSSVTRRNGRSVC